MTRTEKAAEAKRLRDSGLLLREIGERMGLAVSTVHDLIIDPTGEQARERKRRLYSRPCVDCGTPINPGGHRSNGRCSPCANKHKTTQTHKWILESLREWNERFGAPPSSLDWNIHDRRDRGSQWKVGRYAATGRPWPPVATVLLHFGTWNNAIRAADFEPLTPSEYWMGRTAIAYKQEDEAA